jgi:hypothetical protein
MREKETRNNEVPVMSSCGPNPGAHVLVSSQYLGQTLAETLTLT